MSGPVGTGVCPLLVGFCSGKWAPTEFSRTETSLTRSGSRAFNRSVHPCLWTWSNTRPAVALPLSAGGGSPTQAGWVPGPRTCYWSAGVASTQRTDATAEPRLQPVQSGSPHGGGVSRTASLRAGRPEVHAPPTPTFSCGHAHVSGSLGSLQWVPFQRIHTLVCSKKPPCPREDLASSHHPRF